ncbi:MAG: hypothetical protein J2P25_19630 [Nocardiopsaceae bacterium]|nr:hypothetical protein [Nocardiopsaceae bacterium]
MSTRFEVRVEWLDAPGVVTPELAATWARYEMWVGSRCVTQVEADGGTFRRSVYGALYPFAYWIASNWWLLTSHVRPSAVETRYWNWRNVRQQPWLRPHNVRGAGDGMAWPDLTIVPEGAVTRIAWSPDAQHHLTPIRFASAGYDTVPAGDFQEDLSKVVNHVLERLAESGLPKTPLAEEWSGIGNLDHDEQEFCRTVARLGLDPYSIDDDTANTVIGVAEALPGDVLDDFFDSADVTALTAAAGWAHDALGAADKAAGQARHTLQDAYRAARETTIMPIIMDTDQPWLTGYAMARQFRGDLGLGTTDKFDIAPWVGIGHVNAPSHGIYGCASIRDDRCGVVLGTRGLGSATTRFGQARALGRALAREGQHQFILSGARSHDEKVARAFAAELLAPADGIRAVIDGARENDDIALEAAALQFQVSPLLVRHQYDNQIAALSYGD